MAVTRPMLFWKRIELDTLCLNARRAILENRLVAKAEFDVG